MAAHPNDITQLLASASRGDASAQDELYRRVEHRLREIAAKLLRREHSAQTLQATALVDDAFMGLVVNRDAVNWDDRSHFYRAAAKAMRQVLVDHARGKNRVKRGGGKMTRATVDVEQCGDGGMEVDVLDLHDALAELERLDPRQGEVVQLRHFGGHTLKETAKILKVSEATVKTDWASARAWLFGALLDGDDN